MLNTGGGVILDNDTRLLIPTNVELNCGGGTHVLAGNNDYRNISINGVLNLNDALVLGPDLSTTIPGVITKSAIELSDGSSLTGCLVEASDKGMSGTVINPYAPSVWYPGCSDANSPKCPSDSPAPPPVYIRSAIEERDAFSAPQPPDCISRPAGCEIAITTGHLKLNDSEQLVLTGGSGATVRDVTVLGFGTCVRGGSPGLLVSDFRGDCDTVVSLTDLDTPHLNRATASPALTGGVLAYLGIPTPGGTLQQFTNDGHNQYQITVAFDDPNYRVRNGDTVWVAPDPGHGAQSATGRWTVYCSPVNDAGDCPAPGGGISCPKSVCQTFSLAHSKCSIVSTCSPSSAVSLTGSVLAAGYPANAITGLDMLSHLPDSSFISVGQQVSDTNGCIDTSTPGTTVTAVWPAQGIVYLSRPPIACTPPSGDTFSFRDTAYDGASSCADDQGASEGCVIVDTSFRFGNGFYARNAGGIHIYDCTTFEHEVSFYMDTGSRGDLVNCATGNNVGLPDRNLATLNSTSTDHNLNGNIVSLLITGDHVKGTDGSTKDACDIKMTNAVLGQHRNNGIVVQTACPDGNKFSGVGLGVDNKAGEGVALEVDAGTVQINNSSGGSKANVLKAEKLTFGSGEDAFDASADLHISNNAFDSNPLYLANADAAASTVGCGNTFAAPTPYLCAPSSFTQPPGGRLTLPAGTNVGCTGTPPPAPVMTADAVEAKCVFYVPYLNPQVPIYNVTTGVFGLTDIGKGLSLDLDVAVEPINSAYDIFAETQNPASPGQVELCAGQGWTGSARSAALNVVQSNGIWVNQQAISCSHSSLADRSCPPSACTYLGTIEPLTHAGQVSQQFGPNSASTGNPNCLCLYNAYNRVTVTSAFSYPAYYTYSSASWEIMNGNPVNQIYYVDGLAQTQASAQLTDAMKNGTGTSSRTAEMGIAVDTVGQPLPIVIANSLTQGTYSSSVTIPPKYGLRDAIAVESAQGVGTSAGFGGTNLQQLSVQVAD